MHDTDQVTDGITAGIEARKQRGLEIAALARIDKKDGIYIVPSQYNPRATKYRVNYDPEKPTCNCADHETRQCKCKHIYAVEYFLKREQNADGSETLTETVTVSKTRKTYSQDWPNYNAAQTNEKRHFQVLLSDLCRTVESPVRYNPKGGRPPIPLSDSIFSAVYKIYSTVSARRFACDLSDAHESGYIGSLPHYNSVLGALENPALFPILTGLIEQSALPLKSVESQFAVDSTGFAYSRFARWFDIKYNRFTAEQQWVKTHLICGTKTHVVAAAQIHERDTNDSPILPSLVESAAKRFDVKEVSADKGYSSGANHDAIEKVGAVPYIAFKHWTTGGIGGTFAKAFHYFQFNKDEFLAHYHRRSNIESAVSMIKAKFGDAVRSKIEVAAKNEVLCKVLAHNLCCLVSAIYELGITPIFWKSEDRLDSIPATN
jgi:transposase